MSFKAFQYIVFLLIFFSCNEKESFKDVRIISHGVSGLYNPKSFHIDNTKEAMHYVLKFEELEGIEIDVQHSLDGSLWMFHDEFLDDRTSELGRVCEKTDVALSQATYMDLNSTSISRLSSIDWSLNNGDKDVYLDLKNLNACISEAYTPGQFISILDEINGKEDVNVFPIINDTAFAHTIHNVGYKVFSDALSYGEAKERLSLFYHGVVVRNGILTSSEVSNLQINNKKVILLDMFSMSGVRDGLRKYPSAVLVEDFKSAIIERN
ncbi:MAG: hypothetical protein COA32_07080 [Fluviicola sp.]|nr:MAG: hypothetical protein COA32_07080 [Fluviicola sp.]